MSREPSIGSDDVSVVSSAAAYRNDPGVLRVADNDVLFDFASGGVTIGFPAHGGARVEHGADWIEFDSVHGVFRFDQVVDVAAIVSAAEGLPALKLAC